MENITPEIRLRLKRAITKILINEGFITGNILMEIESINVAKRQLDKIVQNSLNWLKKKYKDNTFEVDNSHSSGRVSASISNILPDNTVAIYNVSNVYDNYNDVWEIKYTVLLQLSPGSTSRYYEGSNKQTALRNYTRLLK